MKAEVSQQHHLQDNQEENNINYLWLNGERVIGIEGLEIFEDCRQLNHLPSIKASQRNDLNNIINSTLERFAEEGVCNDWASLLSKTKDYFSNQGYCVVKKDAVRIELRQSVELDTRSPMPVNMGGEHFKKNLTIADLWNIHRQRRERSQRKYIA